MPYIRLAIFAPALLLLSGVAALHAREPASRIRQDLRGRGSFVVAGTTFPRLQSAIDLGPLHPTDPLPELTITFLPSAAQQAELNALLQRQTTRLSSDYHKWLTPEEFGNRFGLSTSDLDKVRQWLESNGLTVTDVARSRNAVSFTGIAAFVETAFSTSLHRYSYEGAETVANQRDIELPTALKGMVGSVRGLHNFRPRPQAIDSIQIRACPSFTNGSSTHYLAPDDFATIYNLKPLYNAGFRGEDQQVVVVGQSAIDLANVRAFRSAFGLVAKDPKVILTGTDPGTKQDDAIEADLDLDWVSATAPEATISYVYANNVFSAMIYAITNNIAPVISMSYGGCEQIFSASDVTTLVSVTQQANAQGITIVASSGDHGAAGCDRSTDTAALTTATKGLAVILPSSLPGVTAAGGTRFQEGTSTYWSTGNASGTSGSALSYIVESSWNDTVTEGRLGASGGGKSILFPKPSWQRGAGVPNDGGRDVPDIALSSSPNHDGYILCTQGSCVNGFVGTDNRFRVAGGTSVAAPTFAGIVTLLNQGTHHANGNINPGLYSLASLSTNAFHDVTGGDNIVPCTAGTPDCGPSGSFGFSAGPGYDQVTGLGSVDAYNLVTQWGSDFNIAITPTTLIVNAGRSSTAQVQVSSVLGFTGNVTFSCSVAAPLTNTTCSVPGTLAGSGTATLTVVNSSTAQALPSPSWPVLPTLPWITLPAVAGWGLLRKRGPAPLALGSATLALLLITAGCDEEGPTSTPALTVTQRPSVTGLVTVTGTSGVESHSATLSVTVP